MFPEWKRMSRMHRLKKKIYNNDMIFIDIIACDIRKGREKNLKSDETKRGKTKKE